MLVFEERGKPEYTGKNLSAQRRTNNKLNPHMRPCPGNDSEPRDTLVGDATAPSLLPLRTDV